MLQVKDICKTYVTGELRQTALDSVSLNLRDNEFVAILGQSGSGKTTLLNIIGGLDRYDSGDLIINGISTKQYKDKDWDAYRNHTIGFVFQSYNLIPHQSILSNVELSLTLSGISKEERKSRATAALEAVGLGNQLHKKPNQLSGGQMQRVAIARALVNEPDIILADEPTGALDSETSVQIMELLKAVAKDKLVIMVTHNPELAEDYATRIIKLKDGYIIGDSDPASPPAPDAPQGEKPGHTKLRFKTALGLSLNNLLTKKGRTFLTAFAGAIGIIGIALIMSLSTGVNDYIAAKEGEIMGTYPIQLQKRTIDLASMMNKEDNQERFERQAESRNHDLDQIYTKNIVADTVKTSESMIKENHLGKFKTFLDKKKGTISDSISAIEYKYDITPQVFRKNSDNNVVQVSPASIVKNEKNKSSNMFSSMMSSSTGTSWTQIVSDENLRNSQYEVIYGDWPKEYNEVALVLNKNNEVTDFTLYTLGIMDQSRMDDLIKAIENGEKYSDPQEKFKYDQILGKTFKVFSPCQMYSKSDNVWIDKAKDADYLNSIYNDGIDVKVTGILRVSENASLPAGVVYNENLTKKLMKTAQESAIVKDQLARPDTNVLTGKAFEDKSSNPLGLDFFTVGSTMTLTPGADRLAKNHAKFGVVQAAYQKPLLIAETTEGELTVTFVNADNTSLSEPQTYQSGEKITNLPKENPECKPTETQAVMSYVFIGWRSSTNGNFYRSNELPQVTESVTYTAMYFGMPLLKEEDYQKMQGILMAEIMSSMTPQMRQELIMTLLAQAPEEEKAQMAAIMLQNMPESMKSQMISEFMKDMPPGIQEKMMASMKDQIMNEVQAQMMEKMAAYQNMDFLMNSEQIQAMIAQMSSSTPDTYEKVLSTVGYATEGEPSEISIYPVDFNGKDAIEALINEYNDQVEKEADQVTYTDLIGLAVNSITSIVDTISYVLIAFVAISLIVSSIMIAIITYISVLERTKEIGVLRAIGASKNDVSKIFNAETFIEGLISGVLGIIVSMLISIPINIVVENKFGVSNIAHLPLQYALVLIIISVVLTFLAGFAPSRMASKKDPVAALRTE